MITDNQNEIFDIVNEKDEVIGQAARGEVHKNKNLIHRSVGVIVFDKKGRVFLQQRSATKDTDPLKWTISASGHVLSGDSYEETALRELKEELGLNLYKGTPCYARSPLEKAFIESVCKYICREPNETEMQMLFKGYSDGPFKLHLEEIIQGKFFTQDELERLYREGKLDLSFSAKVSLGKVGLRLS